MEEVWLQTRKRNEIEERWLQQVQKLQTEVWQALRIAELQNVYASARGSLPDKVRVLLDPLDELASKILFTRKDLNKFLRQWDSLCQRIQDLSQREGGVARRYLDEMDRIQSSIRFGDRVAEWQETCVRLRQSLPSITQLRLATFDAVNNRIVFSRGELQRIWSELWFNLRQKRLGQIRPWKLTSAALREFFLTTSFAFTYRGISKS
jgi:hypothetical protein